jgi:hypothetical protein
LAPDIAGHPAGEKSLLYESWLIMKLKLALFVALLLTITGGAWADCTHCYYLTAGDNGTLTIVNLDTQTYTQTALTGNEYAIAVFPGYENTVGAYQNPGAQYDPNGALIQPLNNGWTGGQWLDGTTDGTHNYTVDFFNGNVYQTDTIFNNASVLFNVGPGFTFIGITFDTANGNLWLADRYGIPGRITEYTLAGVPLFSFDTGIQFISALAYDGTNNSLWVTTTAGCATGTCLSDYDINGNLLSSFSIPVTDNIIGGEISGGGVATTPEPGTLLLIGSGALGLLGAIRRRMSR